jgi:hypothetical protein
MAATIDPKGPPSEHPPSGIPAPLGRATSAAAHEVAGAIQSLARASRSFSLYDAQNEAVKRLIADYRDKTAGLLRRAPIALDIYPFDINLGDESVYKETDRERSLAFRLFRDGVRKIKLAPGVDYAEMVTLLEVLSVRLTGVRQGEEDLITLLRKADFKHIEIEAVEGYMPDEEHPEASSKAAKAQAAAEAAERDRAVAPPDDFDLPLPRPGAGAKPELRAVPKESLAALQAEEAPEAVADQALRAVAEMLRLARELRDDGLRDELAPFVEEVQEYLFVEKKLDHIAKLAALYSGAFSGPGGAVKALPMLGDEKAFDRLLRALPERVAEVPASFFTMLDGLPGDHLGTSLELLATGAEGSRRAALVAIVERAAKTRPELLVERLPTATPALARELFAILGRIAPEKCMDAAFELVGHPDPAFQVELVEMVGRAPANVRLARALQKLMTSPHEEVRVRAAERLAERGGPRAIAPIAELVTRSAATLSATEATSLGRALARASAEDAMPWFSEWARPAKGLRALVSRFAKETPTQRMLAWTAVSGLELCRSAEADQLLVEVLGHARDELLAHARDVVARRAGGTTHG